MHLTYKRIFFLMGMMAFCVLFTPMCSTLCSDSPQAMDVSHATNCDVLSHSFVQTGIGLSAIFIMPYIGLLFLISSYFIPAGFFLSLFKPPRFHT